jgi:hypothetical protein
MIKVTDIRLDPVNMTALCSLIADTKSEVTPTAPIVGLPSGYTIEFGSDLMTVSADMAFMDSTGAWSWV